MKKSKIVATLLTIGVLGLVAVDRSVDHLAQRATRTLLARHPGLAVAEVRVDILAGTVTARGVTARVGGARVRIGSLRLPLWRLGFAFVSTAAAGPLGDDLGKDRFLDGLAQGEAKPPTPGKTPAPASAPQSLRQTGFVAQDVVVDLRGFRLRFPAIEVSGTNLANEDVAALIASKPEEIEGRLRKITAAAIVIPQVIGEPPEGTGPTMTQGRIVLADVESGRIGVASLGPMAFTDSAPVRKTQIETKSIRAVGVDVPALLHILTAPHNPTIGERTRVLESLTMEGARFVEDEGLNVSIGSISTGPVALPAAGMPSLEDLSVVEAFEIGNLQVDDAMLTLAPRAASSLRSVAVAQARFKGFHGGALESGSIQSLRANGAFGRVTCNRVGLEGFTNPLPPRGGMQPAPRPYVKRFEANDLDVSVVDPTGMIAGRRALAPVHASLGRVLVDNENGGPSTIPSRSTTLIEHLVIDVPPTNPIFRPAFQMGYYRVDLSGVLKTSYDAANLSASIDKLEVSGDNMGSVGLRLDLVNVLPSVMSNDPEAVKAAAGVILFKRLVLDARNAGLVDRLQSIRALGSHKTIDQERNDEMASVREMIGPTLMARPEVQKVVDALAKFVAAPRKLRIAVGARSGIEPLGPGTRALFENPEVLLGTIDIEASAND